MRLLTLADDLRAAGLTVVEHPGWKTHATGNTWTPEFGVVHATAAPARQADSVQIDVVRNGRVGLTGPIANCAVDRRGTWHVLAAGRCNTTIPGTAGPYKGLGNTYALGVEGCNDNRREPWPDSQYRSYVRGWAAICRRLGWAATRLVGHKEHTPGHKTDPTFDMDRFRADVAAVLSGKDDDVDAADVWKEPIVITKSTAARLAAGAKEGDKRSAEALLQYAVIGGRDAAARAESIDVKLDRALVLLQALTGRDFADEPAIIAGVLAGLSPAVIAAAIPKELAHQVVDELHTRIAS